jgi:hypothetical protein
MCYLRDPTIPMTGYCISVFYKYLAFGCICNYGEIFGVVCANGLICFNLIKQAYIQQLESSKLKLSQIEQEVQHARQQVQLNC